MPFYIRQMPVSTPGFPAPPAKPACLGLPYPWLRTEIFFHLFNPTPHSSPGSALGLALEATTEAVRVADEAQQSQLSQLRALGIPRPLHDGPPCPRCRAPIKAEAAYICSGCSELFHVRCLHRTLDETRRQTKIELRQYVHTTLCQKCHYRVHIHSSAPQIDDPMGVTTLQLV